MSSLVKPARAARKDRANRVLRAVFHGKIWLAFFREMGEIETVQVSVFLPVFRKIDPARVGALGGVIFYGLSWLWVSHLHLLLTPASQLRLARHIEGSHHSPSHGECVLWMAATFFAIRTNLARA